MPVTYATRVQAPQRLSRRYTYGSGKASRDGMLENIRIITMPNPRFARTRVVCAWMSAVIAGLALPAVSASIQAQPASATGSAVSVRAVVQKSPAHPGESLVIAVVMDHQPGFHTWPAQDVLPAD